MDIERALALNDHIHPDLQLDDDTAIDRLKPREQTSLRSALKAAVPGSGRGSTSNYTRAHKHHGGNDVSDRPTDPPPFSPAGGGRSRPEELHRKSECARASEVDDVIAI